MLEQVKKLLEPHGLIVRGKPITHGSGLVVLIGQVGRTAWERFAVWHAEHPDLADPLDTWSREVICDVAERVGARAVSPSDRPFHPFQQWAMRAEGLRTSPLGILMHPEFGLWHAYRGALLFDGALAVSDASPAPHLCDTCEAKPCLRACPVDAFSETGFRYGECQRFIQTADGMRCMAHGCGPRNACPFGTAYRYGQAQQAFHMQSYARA
ncbi:MAG: hypothetical protein DI629_13495 [Mesorhizobium amorphae]|nr:MAG: hypothetical protein DI629_13495 [Mesorhizobium amorphae]